MDSLPNQINHEQQEPQHQKLINPSSIIDLSNLHNDLSIKKERGPPSLRKKQSQRFTVTNTGSNQQSANQPTEPPPVPALPSLSNNHHTFRSPSISSMSDSDQNNQLGSVVSQGSFSLSNPSSTTTANFTSPGSPACQLPAANLTRTSTTQSSNGNVPPNSQLNSNSGSAMNASSPNEQDDEIIPTAIVIKNIPFNVKREQLLAIIDDLMIPAPYAFNYHFDNGVFRGLAFANFRSASETDAAVAGLNGFDISGRKLRVEYKKVLQAGEKERIEREKALKRMRSMQLQKESMIDLHQTLPTMPPISSTSTHISFGHYPNQEDDYRSRSHSLGVPHQQSIARMPSQSVLSSYPSSGGNHSSYSMPHQAFEKLSISSGGEPAKAGKELDMNDPQTLELYSRVLVFKEDNLRDELAFAKSLSGAQRRIVHQIAKKLGLEHRSDGVGEDRYVVVSKPKSGGPATSHRINRVASSANMNRGGSFQQGSQQMFNNGSSYVSGNNSTLLRMKKSMPDMRPREASLSSLTGSGYPEFPMTLRGAPGRKSTLNLRGEGGDLRSSSSGSQQQPPHSGTYNPEDGYNNHGLNPNNNGQILRQPRGPESCAGKGFGMNKMKSVKSMNQISAGVGGICLSEDQLPPLPQHHNNLFHNQQQQIE